MQEDLEKNVSETVNEPVDQSGTEGTTPETATAAETTGVVAAEAATTEASNESAERIPHRKTRTGMVVSDKMQKSIVVKVTRRVRHPLYKKYFYKSKKFMVHDENNECNVGDTVRIIETRPVSARKRWRLDAIVERAK